eukprot:NODE_246_length_11841_cov_1.234032.p6 type:complete len:120 gc:universal NODE_246_length_11841_cov_1.234032:1573-1932(+)
MSEEELGNADAGGVFCFNFLFRRFLSLADKLRFSNSVDPAKGESISASGSVKWSGCPSKASPSSTIVKSSKSISSSTIVLLKSDSWSKQMRHIFSKVISLTYLHSDCSDSKHELNCNSI